MKVCRIVDFLFNENFIKPGDVINFLNSILIYLKVNNFIFVDFYNNDRKFKKIFKLVGKKSFLSKNIIASRLEPIKYEIFNFNFLFKLKNYNPKINLYISKSDIDGDTPGFFWYDN